MQEAGYANGFDCIYIASLGANIPCDYRGN
jgi:hypothetical protein